MRLPTTGHSHIVPWNHGCQIPRRRRMRCEPRCGGREQRTSRPCGASSWTACKGRRRRRRCLNWMWMYTRRAWGETEMGCRVFGYRAPGNKYSGSLRNSDLFSYTCAHVDVLWVRLACCNSFSKIDFFNKPMKVDRSTIANSISMFYPHFFLCNPELKKCITT
jgi:hypothetical protein